MCEISFTLFSVSENGNPLREISRSHHERLHTSLTLILGDTSEIY